MTDLEKALGDIADIQAQITSARLFKGFGPLVIGLSGVLAICVMALQILRPEKFAANTHELLWVWVCVAVLALILIVAEMWALSRRHHGSMAFKMVRKVAEGFLPALAAGAIMGSILLTQNTPDFAKFLPPIWQFMIALGLFATMGSLHRNLYLIALWYFICASLVYFLLASGQALTPLHMGLPFGLGQIFMALVLARSFPAQEA